MQSKRYVTLDAMRGVAALTVLSGHFGEITHTWQPPFFYLAVDLFFALSGFVLSYSYDRQFETGLAVIDFMRRRAIRLLPLACISSAIALAIQVTAQPLAAESISSAFVSALAMALAVPTPVHASSSLLFPLNSAFWSLFLEFWVANLIFALGWRFLRGWRLWALILASAAGLLGCERFFHSMNIGWSWTNWVGGLARVLFSFFLGVALARTHDRWPVPRAHPLLCVVLLCLLLYLPLAGRMTQIAGVIYILFGFPLLLVLGACGKEPFPRWGAFLGDVSYALYVIHIPLTVLLVWIGGEPLMHELRVHPISLCLAELGFTAGVVALSVLLDRAFDRPVRRGLTRVFAKS